MNVFLKTLTGIAAGAVTAGVIYFIATDITDRRRAAQLEATPSFMICERVWNDLRSFRSGEIMHRYKSVQELETMAELCTAKYRRS